LKVGDRTIDRTRGGVLKLRLLSLSLVLVASLSWPRPARAQSNPASAMDDRWHFLLAPYLWGSGMEGTVGVNDAVSVPIDLSFGDALENLDFAFLGRIEGRKNRIGFGIDTVYMNLGVDVTGPVNGQLGLGADVRSLTVEGVLSYRLASDEAAGRFVDVLAGARYMDNRAALTLERDGNPIAGREGSLDWVDGLVGVRVRLPLGRVAAIHARTDVAGLGSDFTWNLQGGLEFRLGERWKTGAGYRYLDVDYDKGTGPERRIWQVAYHGPYAFVAYAW
jgi:opacity protein-like surface antigen